MKQFISFRMQVPSGGYELEVKSIFYIHDKKMLVVLHQLITPDGGADSICQTSDHVEISDYFDTKIPNIKHYVMGVDKAIYNNPKSFTIVAELSEISEIDQSKTLHSIPFTAYSAKEAEEYEKSLSLQVKAEPVKGLSSNVKAAAIFGLFAIGYTAVKVCDYIYNEYKPAGP